MTFALFAVYLIKTEIQELTPGWQRVPHMFEISVLRMCTEGRGERAVRGKDGEGWTLKCKEGRSNAEQQTAGCQPPKPLYGIK